jgi:DNA-binding transcriptional MerR regulator
MTEAVAHIDIPKRALFKAAEVCDLVRVQPYVLRSWEAEFPALGITKAGGSQRVYRRSDVEQVVRIKNLLLVEGLTLAGARRRLEEESAPVGADAAAIDELIGQNARERLTTIKRGLQSLLELLSGGGSREIRAAAPRSAAVHRSAARRTKPSPGKTAPARRKRSS